MQGQEEMRNKAASAIKPFNRDVVGGDLDLLIKNLPITGDGKN